MKNVIILIITSILLVIGSRSSHAQDKASKKYHVKIRVNYELNQPGDTLTLYFHPHESIKLQQIAIVDDSGLCTFDIEQEFDFGFFTIDKFKSHRRNDHRILINRVYWEKGDDIAVNIKNNETINDYESNAIFTGSGAEKYRLQYELRKELKNIYEEANIKSQIKKRNTADSLMYLEQLEARLSAVLNGKKKMITRFLYDVIKTDILMIRYEPKIERYFRSTYTKNSPKEFQQAINSNYLMLQPIKQFPVSDNAMAASQKFQKSTGMLFYKTALLRNNTPDLNSSLNDVEAYFSGIQKEAIVIALLQQYGLKSDQNELTRIKRMETTYPYNKLLDKFLQQNFSNVYGYTFLDTEGKNIDLKTFMGKYLLIDFWYIGCGACGVYYQNTLSKIEEEFNDNNKIEFVSISADRDFNRWKKAIPLNLYTNERVTNINTGPLAFRHEFAEDIGIYKYPFVILVDPNGYIVEYDTNSIRTTAELLRKTLNKYLN